MGPDEPAHLPRAATIRAPALGQACDAANLAAQSEATFLVEWVANRRVMENFNSVTGVGCDVSNAIPFYHWGSCTALVALTEAGVL